MTILRRVYEAMPDRVKVGYRMLKLSGPLREYRNSPHGLAHTTHVLDPLRNAYAGKRVVLMGNGPSLRRTNWSLLHNEYTIGLNRIYLLKDEMGFTPSFYVCVNDLVIQQFAAEIARLPNLKILDWQATSNLTERYPEFVCIPSLPTNRFHEDIREGWYQGGTVTFAAMQLAYYLGFRQVLLIGVDHRFSSQGPANKAVVSQGADANHFHPDYFGKGVKWHLPDLEESERSYRLAKAAYEADGREIVDCTDGGELTIFRKRSLEEMLR
jgi:hypothetical protein